MQEVVRSKESHAFFGLKHGGGEVKQMMDNKEIEALMKILALDANKTYATGLRSRVFRGSSSDFPGFALIFQ